MSRFRLWPGMIFALLGLNACVVAVTLYLAHSDRSFAVEPEYDRKALAWQETAEQQARNRELNWNVDVEIGAMGAVGRYLTVKLVDPTAEPVPGAAISAIVFHNARPAQRLSIAFTEESPGVYGATAPLDRPGIWHFDLRASAGPNVYTATLERSVPGAAP